MNYFELERDLFTMPDRYALAHCVSMDGRMGRGIAEEFTKLYPDLKPQFLGSEREVGKVVGIYTYAVPSLNRPDDAYILNLVTKKDYFGKPTYESFRAAVHDLKENLVLRGRSYLAMPKIGSGLDRLSWEKCRAIIQEEFKDTDITIIVCIKPKEG